MSPTPPHLPPELLDLILLHLLPPDPTPPTPFLLSLRLLSPAAAHLLTPRLFAHLAFTSPTPLHPSHSPHPALRLAALLAASPPLARHIRKLRLALPPAPNCQPHTLPPDAASYFAWLAFILPHALAPLRALRALHLVAAPEPGAHHPNFLAHCVVALADGVGAAHLPALRDVLLGLPYAGGYGDFFGVEGTRLGVRRRVFDAVGRRGKGWEGVGVEGAGGVNGRIGEAWEGKKGEGDGGEEEDEEGWGEVKVMLYSGKDFTVMPVL